MKLFICQYCGGERKNIKSLNSHQAFCKSNPDRSTHDHSESGKKGAIKSKITNAAKKNENHNSYLETAALCKQCGTILEFNKKSNSFCSRSCGATYNNSRKDYSTFRSGPKPKPKEEKIKVRKKHIQEYECVQCKTLFESNTKRKYCCKSCQYAALSVIAKNNPLMGGNKNTRAYGWYESVFAGRVWLESSWEYEIAKNLDSNQIKWIRPKYLSYDDKKYFPDFYLVDYNVFLDPKNPYLQMVDKDKIEKVEIQNSVRVLVLSKSQLTWDIINTLI